MTRLKCTLEIAVRASAAVQHEVVAGTTLGRSERNHIVVADPSVSAQHARIDVRDGRLHIEDLGSRNGIVLEDGRQLSKGEAAALETGTKFVLGETRLRVVGDREPDDAAGAEAVVGSNVDSASQEDGGQQGEKRRYEPVPSIVPGPDDFEGERPLGVTQTRVLSSGDLARMDAAAREFTQGARPRLIVIEPPTVTIFPIVDPKTTVGRATDCEVQLQRKRVSGHHALITGTSLGRGLQIQDLGSSNDTVVQRATLAVRAPIALEADSYVRFGPSEAVYRCDKREDGEIVGPAFDECVARLLVVQDKLTAKQIAPLRKRARIAATSGAPQEARLGDLLLQQRLVDPRDWAEAALDARQMPPRSAAWYRSWWFVACMVGCVFALIWCAFALT